tara:strand:- start:333 stop:1442 length:1110 start_codon:yes stop_codon:yes gene_type:complete
LALNKFNYKAGDSRSEINIEIDKINTAIIKLSSEDVVLNMNRAAQHLLRISDGRKNFVKLSKILPAPMQILRIVTKVKESERSITERELLLTRSDGMNLSVDCSITPLFSKERIFEGVLVELFDVEQFKEIKMATELTEQSDAWDKIVKELGHEIKNPLTGIKGAAQLLEQELPKNRFGDYLEKIIQETDRLSKLVDRMLGGPVKLIKKEPINLHEILDHVCFLACSESGEKISIEKKYQPPIFLRGDRDAIIQIFLNILTNSVQAIKDNEGNITIETKIKLGATIGRKYYSEAIEIKIIDNGKGIDPRIRDSIFLPLVSDKSDGSGLGLPIAQKLAKSSNGLISIESHPLLTVFVVRFPIGESNNESV